MAALCLSECTLCHLPWRTPTLGWLNRCGESDQDLAQQKPKPADEAADLIAGDLGEGNVAA